MFKTRKNTVKPHNNFAAPLCRRGGVGFSVILKKLHNTSQSNMMLYNSITCRISKSQADRLSMGKSENPQSFLYNFECC